MAYDRSDRRQHPRLDQQLPLSVAANGYDFTTTTQNLSCAGAYCTIKKYIPPFTKLKITVRAGPKKQKPQEVECSGVVVRTDDESNGFFNIAIFFNEIKENPRKKIADYVHNCLAGPALQS